jgi:site-specific DNA-methyltransferase (adenine-specific)
LLEINKIYNMDCLEGMKLLDDNSIDSIVTDPPYELGFMGKKWDSTGIAYNVELWKECLRVLKPGGHLLAFGGTRTYHRMTCAIEDAGFEIRDCIQWLYGSGFPKSHDISKAIDKKLGAERDVIGKGRGVGKKGGETYSKYGGFKAGEIEITASATELARKWNGWGTALKPANEPIVLARKPLSEKTVAENVMKWGTGGLNIDGCRIPDGEDELKPTVRGAGVHKIGNERLTGWNRDEYDGTYTPNEAGRFPANVILDEEAGKLLDEQSGNLKSGGTRPNGINKSERSWKNTSKEIIANNYIPPSEGGASRFFYCAKASKKERGEGNNHPTVKPVSLIKYLITLVTPPDGVCLDPFMGSGTTGVACINTNRNFIGIELDDKYFEIAKKRISEAQYMPKQMKLEIDGEFDLLCAMCGSIYALGYDGDYCPNCGQKIDWTEGIGGN